MKYYGWAIVRELDPISGEPTTASVGYDGPFATHAEALAHAETVAQENRQDSHVLDARAMVEELEEEEGE